MVSLVQKYMDSIAWYSPTTDTDDWQYFYTVCKSVSYASGTAVPLVTTLVKVAQQMLQLQPGLDQAMWEGLQGNLGTFLGKAADLALPELSAEYAFITCFRNNYWQASHNNDLWQSFNDQAAAFQPPTQPGA